MILSFWLGGIFKNRPGRTVSKFLQCSERHCTITKAAPPFAPAPPAAFRTTPATAAKIAERLCEIGDIVDMLEAWEHAK